MNTYEQSAGLLKSSHEDDISKVADDIFSHFYVSCKNSIAIKLIEDLGSFSGQLSEEVYSILYDLTSLTNHKNSKVTLSARQVCLFSYLHFYNS